MLFSIRPNVWGWLFSLCFCNVMILSFWKLGLGGGPYVFSQSKSLNTCSSSSEYLNQIWLSHLWGLFKSCWQHQELGMIGQRLCIISHFPLQPQMGFMFHRWCLHQNFFLALWSLETMFKILQWKCPKMCKWWNICKLLW